MPLEAEVLSADEVALDVAPVELAPVEVEAKPLPIDVKPSPLPTPEELKKLCEQLLPDLTSAFEQVEYCSGSILIDLGVRSLLVLGYSTPANLLLGFDIPGVSIKSGAYEQTFKPAVGAMLNNLCNARWDP